MDILIKLKSKLAYLFTAKVFCPLALVVGCSGLYLMREQIKEQILNQIGKIGYKIERCAYKYKKSLRPEKIIILRHGESVANIDDNIYAKLPDNQIELTEVGMQQAARMGEMLKEEIGEGRKVVFFVSPYQRAQQTAQQVMKSFPKYEKMIIEPRIREQEWGNLQKFQQCEKESQEIFKERNYVGRFYYRFKQGESASDVYDRVSLFLETLYREMDSYSSASDDGQKRVFIIVTHGMVMRLFLMRYFRKTVQDFEEMSNPFNCESWVLNKDEKGLYHYKKKILLKEFEPQKNV